MEQVHASTYTLLGLMFLFAYFANLSTKHARRIQFAIGYLITLLVFVAMTIVEYLPSGSIRAWMIPYNLFLSIGLVLPQLISRMVVRHKINSPIIFLKKPKVPFLAVGLSFLLFAYVAWIALTPRIYDYGKGKPVYDEFYLFSSFSFLVFFIPLVIFYIQLLVERSAICENGLYQGGLLSDWSNFKSYSWSQGEIYNDPDIQPFLNKDTLAELAIEPKRKLFGRRIQLMIPFDDKAVIDNLLSTKLSRETRHPQQRQPHTTSA